jgi:hypothetical protein
MNSKKSMRLSSRQHFAKELGNWVTKEESMTLIGDEGGMLGE